VEEGSFFVDEQRFGPYRMWHHEHHFEPHENGTKMIDKVSYKLPMGFLGNMMHGILVKPQLNKIFRFRYKLLEETFNSEVHDKERVV
jgi:ligand-binding SRPBCC domain-containing protein